MDTCPQEYKEKWKLVVELDSLIYSNYIMADVRGESKSSTEIYVTFLDTLSHTLIYIDITRYGILQPCCIYFQISF